MKAITTKKNSTAKKLVPAAGSLLISAAMLGTSTFAWFTMSREVEVKNIKMTASVPEDMQISLGKLTDIKAAGSNPTASDIATGAYTGLQGNQGRLDGGAGSADNGGVAAPPNNSSDAAEDLYWSNTADISEYYRLGNIIPASSTNGANIYFTPDATGVGKTLKSGANFYQVASLDSSDFTTIYKWNSATKTYATGVTGTADEARATLHAITNADETADKWDPATEGAEGNGYSSAAEWYVTNDDGYYVDIPVWIRSTSKTETPLSVDAFVTTNAAKTNDGSNDDDELYLAARAAIIYTNSSNAKATSNLLRIRKDSFAAETSVTNFMYSTNNTGDAVNGTDGTYGNAAEYDGGTFLTVPARDATTSNKYGNAVMAVVRVWLEGEDPNCWNRNAGQDFNISLKFVKGTIGDKTTAENNANGVKFPADYDKGTSDAATNLNVDVGTTVTITSTTKNGNANGELKFTYDGNKWNQTGGSFEVLDGWTYTIEGAGKTGTVNGATEGANSIAAWLKTNVTNKSLAAGEFTITENDTNS